MANPVRRLGFVQVLIALVAAYLIGSIDFGVIVPRLLGVNIYESGSGNPGTSNVLRTLGEKGPAALVMLGDALKGTVAAAIGGYLGGAGSGWSVNTLGRGLRLRRGPRSHPAGLASLPRGARRRHRYRCRRVPCTPLRPCPCRSVACDDTHWQAGLGRFAGGDGPLRARACAVWVPGLVTWAWVRRHRRVGRC